MRARVAPEEGRAADLCGWFFIAPKPAVQRTILRLSTIFPAMDMTGIDWDLPKGARVVVAMSGGVDSSVVAALCARAGYDVVGITLQLYDHGAAAGRKGACCAGQDIHDARNVADKLGIPHYVLDYESRFRDAVIETFADSYARGETPVPCIECNRTVKFRDLVATARALGAAALATGHYARRLIGTGGPELHAGVDPVRDQSWFLFATTREQLGFVRFPLGALPKERTRALAAELGLAVAAKPDSQDICFVPSGRYADVVAKLRPEAAAPGEIVDLAGRVLGRHDGVVNFTIGQRKGLGVAAAEPLYVVRLDAAMRRVVVGPRAALGRTTIRLGALNWLGDGDAPENGAAVTVRLRSSAPRQPARLVREGGSPRSAPGGGWSALLDTPELGVAAGQACVAYDGSRVLGGAYIRAAVPAAAAEALPA
jgi:tRNA-specific 2-thiouridylase